MGRKPTGPLPPPLVSEHSATCCPFSAQKGGCPSRPVPGEACRGWPHQARGRRWDRLPLGPGEHAQVCPAVCTAPPAPREGPLGPCLAQDRPRSREDDMRPGADKAPVRGVTSVCSPAPSKYTLRGVLIAAGLGWAARLSGGDAAGVRAAPQRGPWASSSALPGSPASGGPAAQRQTPRVGTPQPPAKPNWGLSSHCQAGAASRGWAVGR